MQRKAAAQTLAIENLVVESLRKQVHKRTFEGAC
jgi:hypothetical protein